MRTWTEYITWLQAVKYDLEKRNIKMFKFSATERQEFKECRRRWKYGSFNGMSLESKRPHEALTFGTLIHEALAHYYRDKGDPVRYFIEHWDEDHPSTAALFPLGQEMLRGYVAFSQKYDTNWEVLAVEQEWELPLVDKAGNPLILNIGDNQVCPTLVGTFDLLVKEGSNFIVVDHKTSCMKLQPDELEWNDQLPIYIYACNKIFDVKFVAMWNQLRKKAPTVPRLLKSGGLSKAKDIDTTYETYLQTILQHNLQESDYADILKSLKERPNSFYEREVIIKSERALRLIERYLVLEAMDMAQAVNTPEYPSPTSECSWKCDYKALCRARNIDADEERLISHYFQKRQIKEVYM